MNRLPTLPLPIKIPTAFDVLYADRDSLPMLRQQFEAMTKPISKERCQKAVVMLLAQIPKQSEAMSANSSIFALGMVDELARFPEALVDQAIVLARRRFTFTPSIAEMVGLLNALKKDLNKTKRALRIKENGIGGSGEDYFFLLEHTTGDLPEIGIFHKTEGSDDIKDDRQSHGRVR